MKLSSYLYKLLKIGPSEVIENFQEHSGSFFALCTL